MRIFATLVLTLMLSWSWGQQYEIAFSSDTTDSVCPWVYGHYMLPDTTWNYFDSKNNFKNANVSAIGGDIVFMKCVDITHIDSIVNVDWVIVNNNCEPLFIDTCVSSVAYVLPDSSFPMKIYCFGANTLDIASLDDFINDSTIAYSALFYTKFVQISPTLNSLSKTNNTVLSISDFGVEIDNATLADGSYFEQDLVRWYKDGDLLFQDTIKFISTDTLGGGNYSIRVKNKMVAVFNGDTVLHDGVWSSMSNSVYISETTTVIVDNYNTITDIVDSYSISENLISIYPNPVETTLYISDEVEYCIFSITGQQILSGRGKEIDVSYFKPGVYILKTNNESMRFLVQ